MHFLVSDRCRTIERIYLSRCISVVAKHRHSVDAAIARICVAVAFQDSSIGLGLPANRLDFCEDRSDRNCPENDHHVDRSVSFHNDQKRNNKCIKLTTCVNTSFPLHSLSQITFELAMFKWIQMTIVNPNTTKDPITIQNLIWIAAPTLKRISFIPNCDILLIDYDRLNRTVKAQKFASTNVIKHKKKSKLLLLLDNINDTAFKVPLIINLSLIWLISISSERGGSTIER